MNSIARTLLATATATMALGLAAPASAQAWGDRYDGGRYERGYDNNWRGNGWNRAGDQGWAVEQCRRAAVDYRRAMNPQVTRIYDVRGGGGDYRVRGEVVLDRYGYGRGDDQRVAFTCRIDDGRIAGVDYGRRAY